MTHITELHGSREMGRMISIVLFVVIVGYVLDIATTYRESIAYEPSAQSASVLEAINAISTNFDETGTLVFYPNNVGPVPYLFYQDQNGHTVAKALVFPDTTPADFSSWTGAHISVTGRLDGEHVVVSSITHISAP